MKKNFFLSILLASSCLFHSIHPVGDQSPTTDTNQADHSHLSKKAAKRQQQKNKSKKVNDHAASAGASSSESYSTISDGTSPSNAVLENSSGLYSSTLPLKKYKLEKESKLDNNLVEACYQSSLQEIKDIVFKFQHQDICRPNMPRAILLYGPEGTGKNTIAKMIAQKTTPQMTCWWAHAGALLDSFKNGIEDSLKDALNDATKNNVPCVLLVDEVDALVDTHDNEKDPNHCATIAITYILDKCEKYKNHIFFVFATNKLKKIPSKLRSRLDNQVFYVQNPTEQERLRAIKYWFENFESTQFNCNPKQPMLSKKYWGALIRFHLPSAMSTDDYQAALSKRTNGFSYRRIQKLFENARTPAEKRTVAEGKRSVVILPSDFDIALKSTKQVEKNTQESHWEKTKQFAKDNPVLAGIIGSAIIAGAGFAAYHFFVHKPQMAQSAAQHTASMQQSAEQHTKTMGQAARHHLQNAKLSVLIHEDSLCHAEMLHNDGIETTETLQRELTKRNEEFQKGLQENMKEDSKKLHDAGQQQADHHHNENMNWDKTKTACTGTSAAVAAALFAGDLVTGGTATTIVATGSTVGPMVCDGIAWTYRNGVGAAANKVWDETKGVTGSTWNGTIWVASKTWGGTKYVASGCWNKVTGLFS